MEAILLLVTEFTEELLWAEIAALCIFASIYVYRYVIKRENNINPEYVPAAVVKDYLNQMRDTEASVRFQLFGEASGAPVVAAASGDSAALQAELTALRTQLSTADQRIQEKENIIEELKKGNPGGGDPEEMAKAKAQWDKEKTELANKVSELEEKLKSAMSAGGGDDAMKKELDDMRARLDEYEIIEDDLANLKKYQLENKELREQLEKLGGEVPSGSSAPAEAPAAAVEAPAEEAAAEAPAAEAAPAEEAAAEAPAAEAAPAEEAAAEAPAAEAAPAEEAAAEAPAEEAAAEAPAAEAAPAEEAAAEAPAAEAAPAEEAAAEAPAVAEAPAAEAEEGKEKKEGEEDLLSEFEKMLAS